MATATSTYQVHGTQRSLLSAEQATAVANALLRVDSSVQRAEPADQLSTEQAEALWLHNGAAELGAFGEIDYQAEEDQRALVALISGNPDGPGGATGDNVPGTVNGQSTKYTCPNQAQELQVRYQANPNSNGDDGLSLGDYWVSQPSGHYGPPKLVRVGRSDLDGTRATASATNGRKAAEARTIGQRGMTSAERKAVFDRRKREQLALANGESIDTIEAERAEWLAKRAKRSGAESAEVVAAAIAASADRGW